MQPKQLSVPLLFFILRLFNPSSSFSLTSSSPSKSFHTTKLYSSTSPNDNNSQNNIKKINEQFLEETSRAGYDKVKSLSIEERTKRAMLAEAAEDRVVMLSDELELLLGEDGMPKAVEDRDEVMMLAKQIKASREQYAKLVNGEDCSALDVFNMQQSQLDTNKSSPSLSSEDTMDFQ